MNLRCNLKGFAISKVASAEEEEDADRETSDLAIGRVEENDKSRFNILIQYFNIDLSTPVTKCKRKILSGLF